MLAKTPIADHFAHWVASKPPNERYEWCYSAACACGQFLQEEFGYSLGDVCKDHCLVTMAQEPRLEHSYEVWSQFNQIAAGKDSADWTFGKLNERIKARALAD